MSARGQNARYENDRLCLVLRVTPKGGGDALEGWCCDANGKQMLKVRIAAAPADGKANASLVSLLAKHFAVPQSAVTIVRGATGRVKQVTIQGDSARLSARLSAIGRPV